MGKIDPLTKKPYVVSDHWFRDFLRKFPDLKLLKTSALDLKRMKQASPEVRDGMFSRIECLFNKLKEEKKVTWESVADWPAELKYW